MPYADIPKSTSKLRAKSLRPARIQEARFVKRTDSNERFLQVDIWYPGTRCPTSVLYFKGKRAKTIFKRFGVSSEQELSGREVFALTPHKDSNAAYGIRYITRAPQ
ncbi:MAG: hypothetical protein KJ600_04105 [Nanoarchaeota archaeon]|nr:hypothetical protein [Nanoarchaeota archaeon]MBU1103710.1 hypothetical protein [Nanoarchaeota archaeon]